MLDKLIFVKDTNIGLNSTMVFVSYMNLGTQIKYHGGKNLISP